MKRSGPAVAIAFAALFAACSGGDTTNVYTETPQPTPSASETPTPGPGGANPYSGSWNHFEMKTTGAGFSDFGVVEVDGAGDYGIGLLGGADDTISGTITAAGVVSGTYYYDGGTCTLAGSCESASYCWGTITPACAASLWDTFAFDRNQ